MYKPLVGLTSNIPGVKFVSTTK